MPTITATDLARHTRQILDQVALRHETVVVEGNQTVIVRLVPAEPVMTAAQALEGLQRAWRLRRRDGRALATRQPQRLRGRRA